MVTHPVKPSPAFEAEFKTLMYQESAEAAEVVLKGIKENKGVLERIAQHLRANPPSFVTTCARGSSDHAATYGKYLIETLLGLPVSSAALSTSSIYTSPLAAKDSLCIAISQSGRSPDLLLTIEAYRKTGAYIIALVNDETSPLAGLAHEVLPLGAGPEKSVAATKSYIASLATLAILVAHLADDNDLMAGIEALPDQLATAFGLDWSPALPSLIKARNLFVIGRGYGFGIAQEAALKLKETCALHAEAFSAAEVRHGPMAIVGHDFPVLAMATTDAAGDGVRDVAIEFAERGADVFLADARGPIPGTLHLPALSTMPALEPILLIQSFYRLANRLSLARGLNPDSPPHLSKVTKTV